MLVDEEGPVIIDLPRWRMPPPTTRPGALGAGCRQHAQPCRHLCPELLKTRCREILALFEGMAAGYRNWRSTGLFEECRGRRIWMADVNEMRE